MSWALSLSSFYSWRNWDIESFICLPIATQVGRSETRAELGHSDLRAHTLGHCVKMFYLTSLWSPCFVRSQHLTAGWEPYQNNRKQIESHSNHPAACKHFLSHPLPLSVPTVMSLMVDRQQCRAWGLHCPTWPLNSVALRPMCSLFAPEPVLPLKVKARLMER